MQDRKLADMQVMQLACLNSMILVLVRVYPLHVPCGAELVQCPCCHRSPMLLPCCWFLSCLQEWTSGSFEFVLRGARSAASAPQLCDKLFDLHFRCGCHVLLNCRLHSTCAYG